MAKKILNAATFGIGGGLIKSVFGGKKKAPAAVAPEQKPAVMPLADDEAVRRAKLRSVIRQRGRSGRASTDLTGGYTLG